MRYGTFIQQVIRVTDAWKVGMVYNPVQFGSVFERLVPILRFRAVMTCEFVVQIVSAFTVTGPLIRGGKDVASPLAG